MKVAFASRHLSASGYGFQFPITSEERPLSRGLVTTLIRCIVCQAFKTLVEAGRGHLCHPMILIMKTTCIRSHYYTTFVPRKLSLFRYMMRRLSSLPPIGSSRRSLRRTNAVARLASSHRIPHLQREAQRMECSIRDHGLSLGDNCASMECRPVIAFASPLDCGILDSLSTHSCII